MISETLDYGEQERLVREKCEREWTIPGTYLNHHTKLAGIDVVLFEEQAVTAIHQGSGGVLRKANHLARGALIAAAGQKAMTINADHVRVAATELF